MADQASPNIVTLLRDIVGAIALQQAQIAELQGDRTTQMQATEQLQTLVADLQAHAETGLISQFGDLTAVPAIHEQLTAALPAPAADPATSAPEQQAA